VATVERAVNRRGRPTRLKPEVADAIVAAVAQGATLTQAAAWNGIGLRTLYDWLERGRAEPYGQLVARIEAARPTPLPELLARFAEAARPLDDVLRDLAGR
jgi:hypothetical protein